MSAEYARKLEKEDRQEQLDRQPVGTGPYQLSEYRAGQFIRLQRHDDFWRGKPLMPQVVVDLGSGGTGRLSKLLTGECDVLAACCQPAIHLRDDPRLRLTLRHGMNVAYLAFNTAKPPLNNPAVRHALALAINNQRLMQSIYYGTAETAASILPRASWAYDNEAKITEYNPAKSREQLKSLAGKFNAETVGAHTFAGVEPQSTENCRTDSGGYGAGWRKSGDCAGRRSLSGGAVDGYEP